MVEAGSGQLFRFLVTFLGLLFLTPLLAGTGRMIRDYSVFFRLEERCSI